jgi:pimeloyl-ACP methyl ester carboxylesterase
MLSAEPEHGSSREMKQMTVSDQEIASRFPAGYYPLHPNVALNFQLNRFWNWVGEEQMLDELRATAPRIASYADWTREILELSDKALAAGRQLPAAYYARTAEFFLSPGDPRYLRARQRFLDIVLAENGVAAQDHHLVPYQQTRLSAYRFTPPRPRGTIVIFGGFDSYIEEWLPGLLAFRDAGLDVVAFDGPGQGAALEAGTPMTPDWHLPVAAVLDYFGLAGITLLGFSLGGALVIRAAAHEPRVDRVVAFDVFTDYSRVIEHVDVSGLATIAGNAGHLPDPVVNAAATAAAQSNLAAQWLLAFGSRAMGATTPADLFRAWRGYRTDDASPLITQDVLLMAGTRDHYVPFSMLAEQLLTLTAARSVTARSFTEAEHAQNHCQVGNLGVAIMAILAWLDATGGRDL